MHPELKKAFAEVFDPFFAGGSRPAYDGYELAKLIENRRSHGVLEFHVASLYPISFIAWNAADGSKAAGWKKRASAFAGQVFINSTAAGRRALPEQRKSWREFIRAIERVAQVGNA